jgi:carbonic anhydrase
MLPGRTLSLPFALSLLAACGGSGDPAKSPDDAAAAAPSEAPAIETAQAETAQAELAPTPVAETSEPPPGDANEHAVHAALGYLAPETTEGQSQSPINIVSSRAAAGKQKVLFHYQSSKEHIDNLGHTVKVTYDEGSSLEYDGHRFDLVQFHFHTPSEHLLDGVTYPMEMHLVHAEHDRPDQLLVVGVLFKEGASNPLIEELIGNVPEHAGEHVDKETQLDVRLVLKRRQGYFHYSGSLTTPPYSETVTWLVSDQTYDASAEQIEALNRIEGNNARHIQALNARAIDHWR